MLVFKSDKIPYVVYQNNEYTIYFCDGNIFSLEIKNNHEYLLEFDNHYNLNQSFLYLINKELLNIIYSLVKNNLNIKSQKLIEKILYQ